MTADSPPHDPKNVQGCAFDPMAHVGRTQRLGRQTPGGDMASNQTLADGYLQCFGMPIRGHRVYRACALALLMACALPFGAPCVQAQSPAGSTTQNRGTTHKSERNNAIAAIPFAKLVPAAASQIKDVVESPSIYRKLPVQTIQCDRDLFVFLARNPEVVVHTWQEMGITALRLDRAGPYEFTASDGAGTDSRISLVYGTPGMHVYYGTGVYEGPLFKRKIQGQCVIVLRSQFGTHDEKPVTRCRLDVFVRLPNSAIDVAAKTLHPLFGKAADVNFTETARFFQRLQMSAIRDPQGIDRLAQRLTKVDPQVRQQFVAIAQVTHLRWGQNDGITPPVSPPSLSGRPPTASPIQHASGAAPLSRVPMQRVSRLTTENTSFR